MQAELPLEPPTLTATKPGGKKIVVIGATSSLCQVLCRRLAQQGAELILAGRSEEALKTQAVDIAIRTGSNAQIILLDLVQQALNVPAWVQACGEVDAVIMAAGDMGVEDNYDLANIAQVTQANYIAPAQLLSEFARSMEARGQGMLVVISSVAGDRGRQSNYIYGSAKGALTSFASGLRNRLGKTGVHVLTVKPGFIDTPLTYAMHSCLTASREKVADDILSAMRKRRNIIYTPWFWRYIMLIITHIPECVFKRMKL